MPTRILFPLLWAVVLMAGSARDAEAAASPAASLGAALNQRNIYMKDVAGFKFKNGKPVEDLPREKKVMESAVASASKAGLNPDSVRPFIQAQMDVAKAIQTTFIEGWKKTPEPSFVPKGLEDIRVKILEEDTKIIQFINEKLKSGGFKEADRQEIYKALVAPNLTQQHKEKLVNALFSIKLNTTP